MRTKTPHSFSRLLAIVCCLLAVPAALPKGASAQSEMRIPGTKIEYTFPSRWKYLKTTDVDENTKLYLFCYKQKAVVSDGDTALPYLRIYVRKDYTKPLTDLVFERYMLQPYQSIEDYLSGPGLPAKGGMGYIGAYTHTKNRKDYQFRMVYFKEGNTAVEFRLETTRATYPQMEEEFLSILKSMKF